MLLTASLFFDYNCENEANNVNIATFEVNFTASVAKPHEVARLATLQNMSWATLQFDKSVHGWNKVQFAIVRVH